MRASFFINRRPPQPAGGTTFPIAVSDTGVTNTDTLALKTARVLSDTGVSNTDTVALKTARPLSDTGVSMSDTVARRAGRPLSDTGTTNSDTVQLRTTRAITDTGVTNTDSLTRKASRVLADTGSAVSDIVQLRTSRVLSDTGVANTDSVAILKGPQRPVSDTGASITDTLQLRTSRVLSDTGVTVSDTLTRRAARVFADTAATVSDSVQLRTSRVISDTGVTSSDSLTSRRSRVLSDTGATVTDSITRRVTRILSDTGVTVTDSLVVTRRRVLADTGTTITDSVVITVTTPTGPAITTPLTGYVYGTPASGTVTPIGSGGLVIVSLKGVSTVGNTGYASWAYPATKVAVLGYSNQNLGTTSIPAIEALMGRSFHGLRQNQQYTVTSISTAITEYDAGRTLQYRSIQFNTAPGGWAAAAAGTFDSQLVTFCNNVTAAARWTTQNPFWVCLHHEATTSGGVFGTPGYSAADHKAMWQHCVPVMRATGAPIDFAYVGWDRMFVGLNGVGPPTPGEGFDDLDPGVSFYSRVGSDPYNTVDSPGVLRYGTNAAVLLEPIRQAALARGMDWMIGEFGCQDGATTQDHVNKAAWTDSARVYLDGLGSVGPGVCRVMLTTHESAGLYNADTSAESSAAWQRLGQDAYYS